MTSEPADDALGESSDEEEEEAPPPREEEPKKQHALPSAAELLARTNTTPWLAMPAWATSVTKEKEAPPPKRRQRPPAEATEEAEYGDDMYEFYDPEKGWQHKQATNFAEDTSGYRVAPVAAPPPKKKAEVKKRGRPSAGKERVKHQRLAGQSGVGEDFKVWRSEEDMRLRQQFDS